MVPVVLLVPVVLRDTQDVLVLLDLLVLLVFPARREYAVKEAKDTMDFLEDEDPKVRRAVGVLLVLLVLVSKETRDIKEQQVNQDYLVLLEILDL